MTGQCKPVLALLYAVILLTLNNVSLCDAQGEAPGSLNPVFPSWQRVIEQLRHATAQQKVSAAPGQGKQLSSAGTLVATAAAPAVASHLTDNDPLGDTSSEWPSDEEASAAFEDDSEDATEQLLPADQGSLNKLKSLVAQAAAAALGNGGTLRQQAHLRTQSASAAALAAPQPILAMTANAHVGNPGREPQPQHMRPTTATAQGLSIQHDQNMAALKSANVPASSMGASADPLKRAVVSAATNAGAPAHVMNSSTSQSRSTASKTNNGHGSVTSSVGQLSSSQSQTSSSSGDSVGTASFASSSRDAQGRRWGTPVVDWGGVRVVRSAPSPPGSPHGQKPRPTDAAASTGATSSTGTISGKSSPAAPTSSGTVAAGAPAPNTPAVPDTPAAIQAVQNPLVKLLQPSNLFWWQADPNAPQPKQPEQQKQQRHQKQPSHQPAVPGPTVEEVRSVQESDKQLVEQKILPREPLHVSPPPSITSVTSIDVTHKVLQIPSSFMGISHEWNHIADINTTPGYKNAIRLLSSYGSGPFVIRVGGGSTDASKDLLPQTVYRTLNQVHRETGARFILGLNFEDADLALTRGQMNRARNGLAATALMTFELGNEPNFYTSKKNMTALEYSRCCFTTEWTDFARNLSCPCGTEQCCVDSQLAGPAWGHINVYPSTIKWFLENTARYVSLVTVHWYKATKEVENTAASLLDEGPIRREMDNLKQLVQVANSFGKPLRVAEMNTISNSGRLGVSNVFASALWTLDGAFEVAAAGAVGVNLHQGAGQNLYTAILRREEGGKLKPAVLRPAFYGMLMFQQAVADGSILLDKQQLSGDAPDIKLWPLLDATTGDLRFVIINKNPKLAATQVFKLASGTSDKYQSVARLTRLVAQGDDPLSATSGITVGGRYYATGCEEQGQDATLALEADAGPTSQLTWSIYLPPGSATLVRIQSQAGVV